VNSLETLRQESNKEVYRVAIIIVNWNGKRYLETCLPTVFAQDYQDFTVYLVDNASTDGSVEMVRRRFPQIRLIQNETNLGFCAANNLGIMATKAEFVATLNNDTELEPAWLGQLVEAMKSDPKIGMCASKMMLTDRRDMIESAGIVVDRAGIAWGLESGHIDNSGAATPIPVFGASAGAALYRRSMLLEVGLFDEDLFAYLDDADLAWRGQWADWSCVYVPTAVVYHAHSATGQEGSPFKTRLLGRNKIGVIGKNYPFPHLLWYVPIILAYELMAIGYAVVAGRGGYALKGRLEGLRQLPQILKKRRKLVRRVSAGTMMARLHPVKNPLKLWRSHLSLSRTVNYKHKLPVKRYPNS
jgi:GT2 family glycosyltransferase